MTVITFQPIGGDLYTVAYDRDITPVNPKMDIAQLEKLTAREPFNLEAAMTLASKYAQMGEYAKACEARFRAANEAIEAIPDDDEVYELDWEDPENQEYIEIIATSGRDFYMHGDFEMAAAMLETALSLDSEDHLGVIPQLLFSYVAIEDYEAFDQLRSDIVADSVEGMLILAFAAFRRGEKSTVKLPREMIAELSSEEHEMSDSLFDESARQGRVDRSTAARQIWYRHMPVFESYPEFVKQIIGK